MATQATKAAQAPQARPMEARVGRTNQRYAEDGSRLIAGIVALSADKSKVMLVESSRRPNHWVLPKGGWEMDEATAEVAAQREAWEEAGISGKISKALGKIRDTRGSTKSSKAEGALYLFFEMEVVEEASDWPEKKKRSRKWATYKEAAERFSNRAELKEALDRSSIKKS